MYAGAAISLAGHAAVIGLAVWALPWLRPHPGESVSAIEVSLVGPAEFAALEAAAARRSVVASLPAAATPARPPAEEPTARPEPEPEAPPPEPEPDAVTLGAGFDPDTPLGLPQPGLFAVPLAEPAGSRSALPGRSAHPTFFESFVRPPPRPGPPPAKAISPEGWRDAVWAAIARERVYPAAARDSGIEGAAVVHVGLDRKGRLRTGWLARSSGSEVLDRAFLDAVRDADIPVPPPDLPDEQLAFLVTVTFDLED